MFGIQIEINKLYYISSLPKTAHHYSSIEYNNLIYLSRNRSIDLADYLPNLVSVHLRHLLPHFNQVLYVPSAILQELLYDRPCCKV
jgi:hypothetical protein